MDFPTARQVGILVVIVGTVLVAFPIRTKSQYLSAPQAEVAKRAAKIGIIQPTETRSTAIFSGPAVYSLQLAPFSNGE